MSVNSRTEYKPHEYLRTEANIEFNKMVTKVRRLNRRVRLLERQTEILFDALSSLVQVQETKTLLEHIKTLRDIARRYAEDEADENGGES
jgi:hypothetical protein